MESNEVVLGAPFLGPAVDPGNPDLGRLLAIAATLTAASWIPILDQQPEVLEAIGEVGARAERFLLGLDGDLPWSERNLRIDALEWVRTMVRAIVRPLPGHLDFDYRVLHLQGRALAVLWPAAIALLAHEHLSDADLECVLTPFHWKERTGADTAGKSL